MASETVFLLVSFLLGLLGILAIAIGVVAAVLIGEGEVRLIDTPTLLKDTKVPFGRGRSYE